MANQSVETPALSPHEWSLIAQLLEAKQRELLAEIRHTDKRAFRDALHERLEQVDRLLERIPIPSIQE
jgi:hypothetical protein